VPKVTDLLFQEWRTADRAAFAAEKTLLSASMQAIDGKGVAPTDAERDRVRKLRSTANDLFHLAMAELNERVAAIKFIRK
jgi:hypothetical protein